MGAMEWMSDIRLLDDTGGNVHLGTVFSLKCPL